MSNLCVQRFGIYIYVHIMSFIICAMRALSYTEKHVALDTHFGFMSKHTNECVTMYIATLEY